MNAVNPTLGQVPLTPTAANALDIPHTISQPTDNTINADGTGYNSITPMYDSTSKPMSAYQQDLAGYHSGELQQRQNHYDQMGNLMYMRMMMQSMRPQMPQFDISARTPMEGLAKGLMAGLQGFNYNRYRTQDQNMVKDMMAQQQAQQQAQTQANQQQAADIAAQAQAKTQQAQQRYNWIKQTYGPEAANLDAITGGVWSQNYAKNLGSSGGTNAADMVAQQNRFNNFNDALKTAGINLGSPDLTTHSLTPAQHNLITEYSTTYLGKPMNVEDALDLQKRLADTSQAMSQANITQGNAGHQSTGFALEDQAKLGQIQGQVLDNVKKTIDNQSEALRQQLATAKSQADIAKLNQGLANQAKTEMILDKLQTLMQNGGHLTGGQWQILNARLKEYGYKGDIISDASKMLNPAKGHTISDQDWTNLFGTPQTTPTPKVNYVHLGGEYYKDPATGKVFKQVPGR